MNQVICVIGKITQITRCVNMCSGKAATIDRNIKKSGNWASCYFS